MSVDRSRENLIVCIGSRSKPKITAVINAFGKYPELWEEKSGVEFLHLPTDAQVFKLNSSKNSTKSVKVVDEISKVESNPTNLDDIFVGAKNRALAAFEYAKDYKGRCDFAVGLEAGIFFVKPANSDYMDVSIAAIYHKESFSFGGSPLFEYPRSVVKRILKGEEAGFITDFFGKEAKGRQGVIGPLTKGRIPRDQFEEMAVIMALCPIISAHLYS